MIEVESDILSEVIECKSYHQPVPEYGERAWVAKGKSVDVVYWDTGNTWCTILDVIPKTRKGQREVLKFYKRLQSVITKCYDNNGYRIV